MFLIGQLNFSLGCGFLLHLIGCARRHMQSTGVLPSPVLPAVPSLTSPPPTPAHLFWQTIQTQLEVLTQCKYLPAKKKRFVFSQISSLNCSSQKLLQRHRGEHMARAGRVPELAWPWPLWSPGNDILLRVLPHMYTQDNMLF